MANPNVRPPADSIPQVRDTATLIYDKEAYFCDDESKHKCFSIIYDWEQVPPGSVVFGFITREPLDDPNARLVEAISSIPTCTDTMDQTLFDTINEARIALS